LAERWRALDDEVAGLDEELEALVFPICAQRAPTARM